MNKKNETGNYALAAGLSKLKQNTTENKQENVQTQQKVATNLIQNIANMNDELDDCLLDDKVYKDYTTALNNNFFANISENEQKKLLELDWNLAEILLIPFQKIEIIIKTNFLEEINFLNIKTEKEIDMLFREDSEISSDSNSKQNEDFKERKKRFKNRELHNLKKDLNDNDKNKLVNSLTDKLTLGKVIGFSKVISENKYKLANIFEHNTHIEISSEKSIMLGDHFVMIRNLSSHLNPYKPTLLNYLKIIHDQNSGYKKKNPNHRADITTINLLRTLDEILIKNDYQNKIVSNKCEQILKNYVENNNDTYGVKRFLKYEPPRNKQPKPIIIK